MRLTNFSRHVKFRKNLNLIRGNIKLQDVIFTNWKCMVCGQSLPPSEAIHVRMNCFKIAHTTLRIYHFVEFEDSRRISPSN